MSERERHAGPQAAVAMAAFFVAVAGAACHGLSQMDVAVSADDPSEQAANPEPYVPPAEPRLRLLNAEEYRNTVRDLLGLEATQSLPPGDTTGGFDTGAYSKLDENRLLVLLSEAERLGQLYVAHGLRQSYACFDPASLDEACLRELVQTLGRRTYRRPLHSEEAERLVTYFQTIAAQSGDANLAAEFLVARLLTSSSFLYRPEVGAPVGGVEGSALRTLNGFERASLLSYALTASMPDELLLQDAEQGRLLDDEVLAAHVRRLVASPKGQAKVVSFFKQWLRVASLDDMAQRPEAFPKLASAAQAQALRDEFAAFVTSVVFEGEGTLAALLTEPRAFANQHTAALYGVQAEGDLLTELATLPAERRGILTLASTMAAHGAPGDATRDRPVKRGLMVLNQLLCEEVGPPSGINTAAAASNVAEKYPDFDLLTVREQSEAMMEQGAQCASCHRQFMPIGYLFGNFDGLGRRVTTRFERPIVTAVMDVPVEDGTRAFPDALAYVDALSRTPKPSRCFTQNLASWITGTAEGPHQDALSEALFDDLGEQQENIPRLLERAFASPYLYLREEKP